MVKIGVYGSVIAMFVAVITFVMAAQSLRAEGRNPTDSRSVLPVKVVVAITSNRWTAEKVLIATDTLTNTASVPIRVTKIFAAGFDKNQKPVVDDSDLRELGNYTIGENEIASVATVIFKVALSDTKRRIRFVTAMPEVEVIPPPDTNTTSDTNAFGGCVVGTAGVFMKVGSDAIENILGVAIE